ncbi:phosphatase PAP2 family protein [Nocardioides sediminis]|uniref:phosphatase PAP2 family protein n=1 Tax=Nocardioides sediminis TaxID=433648 RepID=UPI000D2FDF40|nr:phosphatase PAP2 family protein [Nocardioides sediminis]
MTELVGGRRLGALAWPAATATAYAVAFVLVYYVSVRTVRGRSVSDAALRGAISSGASIQDTVEAILDIVSVGSLLGAVAMVAVIALVRLDRVRGLASIGVLVTANASTWLLKEHLLTRPDLGLDEIAPATLNSLPSGHTTAAFSAVAALMIVLPAAGRVPAALLGGAFVTVVALATMFAGWHRTADAMAAFLVVGMCTMAAISVIVLLDGTRPHAHAGVLLQWWVAAAVGALFLGSALVAVLSALAPLRDTLPGSLLAFLSAGLLIVGTLLGVLVGMLWVLAVTEDVRDGAST